MGQNRANLVYQAKLCEQAERYDEMVAFMKEIAATHAQTELSVEERNLLSVACKNAVGCRRASWRIISTVEQKVQKGDTNQAQVVCDYRKKVEDELRGICEEVLQTLEVHLLPVSKEGESCVFYYKMKGDYHRYLAEIHSGEDRKKAAELAKQAYKQAMETAETSMPVTHPIRLGLALNFSVFHYEVLNNAEEAVQMARTAFEDSIADLDNVPNENYKDSTLIMQLLRDNLTLWAQEHETDE